MAGDVMFVRAYEYLNKIQVNKLQKVLFLFNETAAAVCEGQQLDMDFEKRTTVNLDEYVTMITLKTSVLLAASLQLGAILGGAGEGNQHHLYEFGKNLGIAFQLHDDILDVYGDAEKFGKQVGGDILSNKKTVLFLIATELAEGKIRTELLELLQKKDFDPEKKIEAVIAIYEKLDVKKKAIEKMDHYFKKAVNELDAVDAPSGNKEALFHLAEKLMVRER